MFCSNCGKENPDNAKFCASCGNPITDTPPQQYTPPPPPQPQYAPPQPQYAPPQYAAPPPQTSQPPFQGVPAATGDSPKSKTTAAILAFFLGTLGIHRFYAGKTGSAVVMLILSIIGYIGLFFVFGIFVIWAVEIWAFIDFIIILMGKFKDKNGLYIKK